MRAEDHPRLTVTEEEWERMVPLTIERVTQANQNPRSRLSAVPGRSGSSEVYRGLRILKSGYGQVSKEEIERAAAWERDMSEANSIPHIADRELSNRTLQAFPELEKEARELCPECDVTPYGILCKRCVLGGIPGKNKVSY